MVNHLKDNANPSQMKLNKCPSYSNGRCKYIYNLLCRNHIYNTDIALYTDTACTPILIYRLIWNQLAKPTCCYSKITATSSNAVFALQCIRPLDYGIYFAAMARPYACKLAEPHTLKRRLAGGWTEADLSQLDESL